jgi:hypothetical protein
MPNTPVDTSVTLPEAEIDGCPVEVRYAPLPWMTLGLHETASGYGSRLRMPWMVRQPGGRWRRVKCYIYSNVGTCFVGPSLGTGKIVGFFEACG